MQAYTVAPGRRLWLAWGPAGSRRPPVNPYGRGLERAPIGAAQESARAAMVLAEGWALTAS